MSAGGIFGSASFRSLKKSTPAPPNSYQQMTTASNRSGNRYVSMMAGNGNMANQGAARTFGQGMSMMTPAPRMDKFGGMIGNNYGGWGGVNKSKAARTQRASTVVMASGAVSNVKSSNHVIISPSIAKADFWDLGT